MHRHLIGRIFLQCAFLVPAAVLRADITLPRQAPPQVDAQSVSVRRGERLNIPLRAHYGGVGTVSFAIVERPAHGKLSDLRLLGDNRATILYENDGAAVTSDGFRYVARAGVDRISSPAEVRITVEEAPARMDLPEKLAFDEIMAGAKQSRPLAITNEGGGVLEGRMAVSAPWRLTTSQYRVKAGATELIEVIFQPEEGRKFFGQIALTGTDGAQGSVALEGSARASVRIAPDPLQIAAPKSITDYRAGTVSLTNATERALRLKMEASSRIQPIPEIALAPRETKEISLRVLLPPELSLHEDVAFVGAGSKTRLRIEARAAPGAKVFARSQPEATRAPMAAPTPTAAPAQPGVAPAASTLDPALSPPAQGLWRNIPVRARRLKASRWELSWPQPQSRVANYRIEERLLSLDGEGELQISWRELRPANLASTTNPVTAQVDRLNPRELHMLRVTALGADSATLWESPLVALPPVATRALPRGFWLLALAAALATLLFLRWRARSNFP